MVNTKSAFVAIVGKPNVGKSSLMNALLGEKIAIVTDKPQTTRTKITGVLTQDETQYVFIDTPGLHKPKTKLSEHMVKTINESVADVDVAVLVVEPKGEVTVAEKNLIDSFKQQRIPAVLVINKIDTVEKKDELLTRINQLKDLYTFDAVLLVSALNKDGIPALLDELQKFAQESVHFFPDDTLTDQPERVIVAEIIREKLLMSLHQEIPHGTAVAIEKMKDREDKAIIDIDAIIFCEKDSHKGMIIGKGGSMLKKVASEARIEIESFLDAKINLQCWVKVKDDWRNKEGIIRTLGLS
ncbi:MAG: era [Oscillospiraceae bacterium]|jgi:GTP-binding protein Era|nr:era [Oscillospiraceae bacterium]